MNNTHRLRFLAVATTFITGVIAPITIAAAQPNTAAEKIAESADFIAREIAATGTNLLNGPRGNTDIGLSIDAVFALDVTGTHAAQANATYAAVRQSADSFIYDNTEVYAGKLAKLVALESSRNDINTNHLDLLISTVQDDGRIANEVDNTPTDTTVYNFSQAWAVIALHRSLKQYPNHAGLAEAAQKTTTYLNSQQCPDGGMGFSQQTPPRCNSVDVDTTALSAQAFTLAAGATAPTTTQALTYLRSQQSTTGGVRGFHSGDNTNTTALAASAFSYAGDHTSYTRTWEYLDTVRFHSPNALKGGFALKKDSLNTITEPNDQVRRASVQALVGYAGKNYAESITAPQPPSPPTSPTASPSTSAPQPSKPGSSGGMIAGIIAIIVLVLGALAAAFTHPQIRSLLKI